MTTDRTVAVLAAMLNLYMYKSPYVRPLINVWSFLWFTTLQKSVLECGQSLYCDDFRRFGFTVLGRDFIYILVQ